jgi:beta-xylosidase
MTRPPPARELVVLVLWMFFPTAGEGAGNSPWIPDNGDGTYTNPVIFADYSDPDVIRVGDDFTLVASSFNCMPGLPILHSNDLVNWTIVGHAITELPSPEFATPQHGKGVWAPSIRYHNGMFWIYYGDPDNGIFLVTSEHAEGPWHKPVLVHKARGWIDPCPLWDNDSSVYLVHAWAKSRSGFNSILTVNKMSPDGMQILDDGVTVFDGHATQPTIEGPKFYKRGTYYYIFAPAGGVTNGWQTVLRSENVLGPYEERVVMQQGSTNINGPHQGAWVNTPAGESWFVHFQDRGPYGRVVLLQPLSWENRWPVIGTDRNGDGTGEPVSGWKMPYLGRTFPVAVPQTSDEFESPSLGLQWQWEANGSDDWFSTTARPGFLRLYAKPGNASTLWETPNLLLQKFPAPQFIAETSINAESLTTGASAGLVVMGLDYCAVTITPHGKGLRLHQIVCHDAENSGKAVELHNQTVAGRTIQIRVEVDTSATCSFSFSVDGVTLTPLEGTFTAREGKWTGAKVGLFCADNSRLKRPAYVDIDWFRVH